MLRKFAGNTFFYLLGSLLTSGISFLLLPIYTRHLTPTDYGILAVCTTTYSILSMTITLGLDGAIPLFYYKLDKDEYRNLLRILWLWHIAAPLLPIALLSLAGRLIASSVFPSVPYDPYLRLALWIAYFTVVASLPLQQLRAEQRGLAYLVFTLVSFVVTTVMLLYFVVARGQGALGSLRGQLIGATVVALLSHIMIASRCWAWRGPWIAWNLLADSLKLCVPYMPHMVFSWALNVSDRWILAHFVAMSDLGIYSLAYTLALPVQFAGLALVSAYAPIYYERAEEEAFQNQLPRLLSGYLFIHTCIALAICLLAPEALRLMTRPAYYPAAALVPWIAASYWFFAGLYCVATTVLIYHKRTGWTILITGPPALLNIGLNWLYVPRYGILAAAVNTLVAFALMAAIAVYISRRLEKLPYPWVTLTQMLGISAATYYVGQWVTWSNLSLAIGTKIAMLIIVTGLMGRVAGVRILHVKSLLKRTPDIGSATAQ